MRVTCILCFEVGFEARGMYSKVEKLTCLIITFNGKKKKLYTSSKRRKFLKYYVIYFRRKFFTKLHYIIEKNPLQYYIKELFLENYYFYLSQVKKFHSDRQQSANTLINLKLIR